MAEDVYRIKKYEHRFDLFEFCYNFNPKRAILTVLTFADLKIPASDLPGRLNLISFEVIISFIVFHVHANSMQKTLRLRQLTDC